ncbi:hypothetical protein AHiyo4_04640 [Arthrobacter sp. Hiyo4]|nr:hypothetical protein AHiyo4_04640 [Arthrobacter sp. Hiyo4]
MISTFWPVVTCPASRTACNAVTPEMGATAASSNVRFVGFVATRSSLAQTNSAKDPSHVPNTSSPSWKRVTPAPTASTTPATSRPRTGILGFFSPKPKRRSRYGRPVIRCHTPWSTPAARTLISTSPSLGTGSGISLSWSMSAFP